MIVENVTFVTLDDGFGNESVHAIIENANGGFTSMPKSTYDELQVAQSTMLGAN